MSGPIRPAAVGDTGGAAGGGFSRIDQFVPSLARHDAIGNHVMQVRRLLRGAGYRSDIYHEHIDDRLATESTTYLDSPLAPDPDRLILYHASTHSEMTGWLIDAARRGQQFAIYYHNITPAEFFAPWEPEAASSMQLGRRQLAELVPWAMAGLSASAYNAAELEALGLVDSRVCPLLLDLDDFGQPADAETARRLRRPGPLWLFVGRIAPNKCQHDVLAAFALYRAAFAPKARLALVGGTTSGRYRSSLEEMIADLGLGDAVALVGSAPFPSLLAYYRSADVFVCMSRHEGFCVPVIEAMELGLPVVARPAAAVTETVAGAGLLLDSDDPLEVAVAVDSMLSDPARRQSLVESGHRRAAEFALAATSQRWLAELADLGGRPRGDAPASGSAPGRPVS